MAAAAPRRPPLRRLATQRPPEGAATARAPRPPSTVVSISGPREYIVRKPQAPPGGRTNTWGAFRRARELGDADERGLHRLLPQAEAGALSSFGAPSASGASYRSASGASYRSAPGPSTGAYRDAPGTSAGAYGASTYASHAQDRLATAAREKQRLKVQASQDAGGSRTSPLIVRLLEMRTVKNMTKNGKLARFSATVAVGNGRGSVGVAHGKSVNVADAVAKATRSATAHMEFFPRFQDRTLFHDDRVTFKATNLDARPSAHDAGPRCHPTIGEICRCVGIKDISASVHGSRLPMNVAEAFLLLLRRQKTPEDVARDTGMNIVDVRTIYQQGCDELSRTLREKRFSTDTIKAAAVRAHKPIAVAPAVEHVQ